MQLQLKLYLVILPEGPRLEASCHAVATVPALLPCHMHPWQRLQMDLQMKMWQSRRRAVCLGGWEVRTVVEGCGQHSLLLGLLQSAVLEMDFLRLWTMLPLLAEEVCSAGLNITALSFGPSPMWRSSQKPFQQLDAQSLLLSQKTSERFIAEIQVQQTLFMCCFARKTKNIFNAIWDCHLATCES